MMLYIFAPSYRNTQLLIYLCSTNICMDIDFMSESDSYGSDHFAIVLKIAVSLPNILPRWNFSPADWGNLIIYVNKN